MAAYDQSQPQSILRGELIGYEIRLPGETRKLRSTSNYIRITLPGHSESKVEIFSMTNAGYSLEPAIMYVPGIGSKTELALSSDIQLTVKEILNENRNEKNLLVTWRTSEFYQRGQQVSLTFYMCEESQPSTCFSDYEIRQVDAERGQLVLKNVSRALNLFGYALSSNSSGSKTGIQWTDCVYQDGVAPPKPTGLQAIPGPESGSVQVVWYNMRCNRGEKVLINQYNLKICPANLQAVDGDSPQEHQSCQNAVIASSENSSHVFRNLKAGQSYLVELNAESANSSSPNVTAFVKASSEPSSESIIGTVMGILITVISSGIIIFVCCKYCRGKFKKADDITNQSMKLMEQPNEDMTTNHLESDSGVHTTADSTSEERNTIHRASKSELSVANAVRAEPYEDTVSYSKQGTFGGHVGFQKTGHAFFKKRNVEKPMLLRDQDHKASANQAFPKKPMEMHDHKVMGRHQTNVVVQNVSLNRGSNMGNQPLGASEPLIGIGHTESRVQDMSRNFQNISDAQDLNSLPPGVEYSRQGLQNEQRSVAKVKSTASGHRLTKREDGYTEDPTAAGHGLTKREDSYTEDPTAAGHEFTKREDGYTEDPTAAGHGFTKREDGYTEDPTAAGHRLTKREDGYTEDPTAAVHGFTKPKDGYTEDPTAAGHGFTKHEDGYTEDPTAGGHGFTKCEEGYREDPTAAGHRLTKREDGYTEDPTAGGHGFTKREDGYIEGLSGRLRETDASGGGGDEITSFDEPSAHSEVEESSCPSSLGDPSLSNYDGYKDDTSLNKKIRSSDGYEDKPGATFLDDTSSGEMSQCFDNDDEGDDQPYSTSRGADVMAAQTSSDSDTHGYKSLSFLDTFTMPAGNKSDNQSTSYDT
ncbi:rho termination factor, N-terminal domain protein [Elysia marginata]|uniref:Rho termination factor, N-terminal domain protein n=1 Tax=Elysia marginata TaxID=1093978 RepID=A0AAV4IWH8_9GAST|nr:rho termination factor, N-terminal domain protein [Elysia marginata]